MSLFPNTKIQKIIEIKFKTQYIIPINNRTKKANSLYKLVTPQHITSPTLLNHFKTQKNEIKTHIFVNKQEK